MAQEAALNGPDTKTSGRGAFGLVGVEAGMIQIGVASTAASHGLRPSISCQRAALQWMYPAAGLQWWPTAKP